MNSAASRTCWIEDRGVTLVTVLAVLTVLLGLGLAALALTLIHKDISRTEVRNLQALYAAEAGIQVALAQLAASPEWPGYDPVGQIGSLPAIADQLEGSRIKEILLTPQGEVLQVEARGEAGDLTRQVAALLRKPAWAFGLIIYQATAPVSIGGNSYLRGTFIFAGDVTIGSSVQVGDSQAKDGWIIAGGDVVNKGVVYGGVRAHGVVDNSRGSIVGVLEQGVGIFIPPVTAPDLQFYYLRADERLVEPDGEVELTGEALQGFINAGKRIVYVDGDLVLDEKDNPEIVYDGQIALVASGSIEVRTDVFRRPGTQGTSILALIAGEDIIVRNREVEALLWAGGELRTYGTPSLRGAAAAAALQVSGGCDLVHDLGLASQFWNNFAVSPQEFGFKMVRWWAKGS